MNDNGDSSNNGTGYPKKQQQNSNNQMGARFARERREEMELFQRFRNLAASRINQLANEADDSNDTKLKHQMGQKEQELLLEMNGMGLREGIAAGIVTFVTLRRGPIVLARWLQRRRSQMKLAKQNQSPPTTTSTGSTGSTGYRLSDPNATATTNPFQRAANEPPFPRSKNIVLRGIWFVFDGTLSLMMAASVSMAYTDVDRIRNQLIELPLVEGKSLVSDVLCQDVLDELKRVKDSQDPAYQRLTSSSKINQQNTPAQQYLEGIIKFAEHCERRKAFEHSYRQERGMRPNEPVMVPAPGIPKDGPRLITLSDGTTEMVVSSSSDTKEDVFRDDDEMDTEWASDFVTDQEDQMRNMSDNDENNRKNGGEPQKRGWW